MIVSRRMAITSLATAAGTGSAATGVLSKKEHPPAAGRERVLASRLGIRGDNTTTDTDHAQRMIEEAARNFRAIHFEGQREWVFRTSLTLFGSEDRGSTVLRGEGAYVSAIRCSDLTKPVLVNDPQEKDFRRLSIRGLAIRGGSRGLSIRRHGDQVASLCDLNDVRFEFQKDIGLYCDQYLISSSFSDVVFYYCNRGIFCGRNANNVLFLKCRFEGLNDRAVEFASPGGSINGCEDVRFVSPRFEGRNQEAREGVFVIGGYRLSTLTVEGGYFEDSHETILRERGGLGQVAFRNCHFSGQARRDGQFQREIFDSDSIVALDGNRFVVGTDGPRHVLVSGVNRGLAPARFGRFTEFGGTLRYVSPFVALGNGPKRLCWIGWTNWASLEDRQSAAMIAEVTVSISTEAGGLRGCDLLRCDLLVTSGPGGKVQGRILPSSIDARGYELAVVEGDRGGIAVTLAARNQFGVSRSAIVDIRAVLDIEGEPPFMVE